MMKPHFTILAVLILALSSCGAEEGQKAATDVKAAAAKKKPPAKKAPAKAVKIQEDDDGPSPLTVPDGYRYEQAGRRDPFVNPVPKPKVVVDADLPPTIRPEGIAGVLVSEARVTAISTSNMPGMTKAMLTVGKTTYFVVPGTHLFDAVIKEIRSNEVVFTMISPSTKQPVNREVIAKTGSSAGTSAGEKK